MNVPKKEVIGRVLKLEMSFEKAAEIWPILLGKTNEKGVTLTDSSNPKEPKKFTALTETLLVTNFKANAVYCTLEGGAYKKMVSFRIVLKQLQNHDVCEDDQKRFVGWNRIWKPHTKRWERVKDAAGQPLFPLADFEVLA